MNRYDCNELLRPIRLAKWEHLMRAVWCVVQFMGVLGLYFGFIWLVYRAL